MMKSRLDLKHSFLSGIIFLGILSAWACSPNTKDDVDNDTAALEGKGDTSSGGAVLSAKRYAGESFAAAKERAYREANLNPNPISRSPNAEQAKVAFDKLDDSTVVSWPAEKAMEGFTGVRDLRYLSSKSMPDFPRRLTWLYPDDGCFTRAHGMNSRLPKMNFDRPNTVFIYGNLHVKTDNSPDGYVEWWYHVAPIVKIDGQVYVIDPALEPKNPLLLKDWVLKQVTVVEEAELSFCDSQAVIPSDTCHVAKSSFNDNRFNSDIQSYLRAEWSRQLMLKRNPEEVLGDNPPWKNIEPNIEPISDATTPANSNTDAGVPTNN